MIKTGIAQGLSYLETKRPFSLEFTVLDQEEILKSSVVSIRNERIYEANWMFPTFEGVNDPRMGTCDKDRDCLTCRGSQIECPGHFGHIELAKPVYHAGFLEHVRKILKCVCFNCGKVLYPRDKDQQESIKRVRYSKQRFNQIMRICERYTQRYCELGNAGEGCGMRQPKFHLKGLGLEVEFMTEGKGDSCNSFMENLGYTAADKRQTVWPEDVLRVFNRISEADQAFLGVKKPSNMILRRLLVAPPPVRPAVSMGGTMKSEDDLTYAYQMILKANNYMALQMQKGANTTTLNELRRNLQFYVATLMNNCIPGQPTQRHKSGKPLKAITQRLKGKEGRVRGNLMGKRVDFSARSVITPDPNLELDQLGVPVRIAETVTVPITATANNIDELRHYVQNGPSNYPGAKYIIRQDKRQIDLGMLANRADAHLEPGYIVERHLVSGDYVVFNRQPSLHKMSAMGHQVRVLPYSTFRLNLSVTTPYNADFDGDEMNMFIPQSYEALAEVKELMAVPHQIVSPQSNKPVMGIVQDSLLGIMLFSRRDCFIDKHTAMNLMMWLDNNSEKQLPIPAILKPRPLWSGKQILSLVIPNVNLIKHFEAPSKNPHSQWCSNNDSIVLISKGELLAGCVNKSTVGASQQGLVHVIWRECGPIAAKNFLSNSQKVVNQWLAQHGFTVGVQDAIASKVTMHNITEKLTYYRNKVYKIVEKAEKGELKFQPGKNLLESLEVKVNATLNMARDEAGQIAFKNLDPQNKIQNMVGAGSKGTNINISQIMGCVGQQNVEGKRIPFGFKHRSLPHFCKYDFGPESKGFVKSNYLCGLEPTEFFFHAMGGREGLIDTAVKTSETGYIQRRLVKALEDVIVKYDGTVRNSSEQVIQFLYGEDGMAAEFIEDVKIDIIKQSNQELEQRFNFIPTKLSSANCREYLRKSMDDQVVDEVLENPSYQMLLMNEMKQIIKDRDELRNFIQKNGEEQTHVPVNIGRLLMNCEKEFSLKKNQTTKLSPIYVVEQINKLIKELSVYPGRNIQKSNTSFFYEANDNSTVLFKIYLRQELCSKRIIQQERMTQDSFDWLLGEIKSRFESSLINPGETVGSIAAHSIGEPATQMTLNTFHFAGVSSKNVTLGVPRLKEVINVAKNIRTPMISVYLQGKKKKSERSVMKLQGDIELSTLGDVLVNSQIYYDPDPKKTIVQEDESLVALYNEVPESTRETFECISPWVLRLKLDQQKMVAKTLDMDFINKRLTDTFQDQISIMHSDQNDENLVFRLRFKDLRDDPIPPQGRDQHTEISDDSAILFLQEIEDNILNELTLKGIKEISKVYAKKYNETEYDPETGAPVVTSDNWMLETDGVALQKILTIKRVDFKKTVSNDINELLTVLGIEAVRRSLINELRVVLNFYGIYVNYRHLAILCDVMTQKGRLTSITRHGINRLDSGPLRKCSFEETVDIFLEAAIYNETDYLTGVTENIILGQTAPFGTGAFDLAIDPDVLQQYTQATTEEELVAGDTPMLEDNYENYINPYMTEYMQGTPMQAKGGMTSEYCRTPGGGQSIYEQGVGFSPGYNAQSPAYGQSPNAYNSPASPSYRPASPVYGYGQRYQSPIYMASPIYQPNPDVISPGQVASPIGGYNNQHVSSSGGHHSGISQSPVYSPNQASSQVNSPYITESQRRAYSPSYIGNASKTGSGLFITPGASPSLVGNSPASPSYSPPPVTSGMLGSHHQSNANSPAYSPTLTRMASHSPNYSPTTTNYNPLPSGVSYQVKQTYSPAYSPTTSQYANASPKYNVSNRTSPKYTISGASNSDQLYPSVGSPKSVTASQHEAGSSSAHESSVYVPQNYPRYNASSPAYRGSDYAPASNDTNNPRNNNIYDPTRSATSKLYSVQNNSSVSGTVELSSPQPVKNESVAFDQSKDKEEQG